MPSRVFAAPSSGHSGDLIAVHPQRDESFVSPVLAGPEDGAELVLDFQGHKHVDPSEGEDQAYVLQDDTSSSHTKFTMPGQATVNALRDYLLKNLQAHQVVDGYGNVCKMFEISNDHLAVLQTKIWTKTFSGRSPVKTTVSRPSRAQTLMSGHIARISRFLEENHLFVLSETEHAICHYSNDSPETTKRVCHSQIFRIEPLVHWGTVIPATAFQFMASFRRNGSLMQIPAYEQIVRNSIDANTPTYCFDCLEYLWSKRTEAWGIIRRLEDTMPQISTYSSRLAHRTANGQMPGGFSPTFGASVLESVDSTAYQGKADETEMYDEVRMAPCLLDGTSDYLDVAQSHIPHTTKNQGVDAVWELSESEDVDEHCERMRSSSRSNSLTLLLRMTPVKPRSSDNFLPINRHQPPVQIPISTVPQTNSIARGNECAKRVYTTNKYGFRVKVQTPPPRAAKREFGRELDTNSTIPLVQVRRSPCKHIGKASTHEGASIQPMEPLRPSKPLKRFKKARVLIKETKKRKNAPTDLQTCKQKMVRKTVTGEPNPTGSKPYINSTAGLRFSPEPQLVVLPLPAKFVVHFAKRPLDTNIPDGVVALAYAAFQNDHPAPMSKICVCNKPASYGLFKKSELSQITQCVNRDCRFRWYHYACLNLSEKGKARWGTFVCQYCRNEEEFAEKDRKNGWNMARQVDFRINWTKDDIEADVPGLGGHGPVANPYGLGVDVDLGPAFETASQTKGVLGDLEPFEYAQSHPHMLVEAYSNPAAYAQLRAECAGDEANDEQWRHETHTTDEDYLEDEETLDLETEEEL
ncbi:uncharacterized protein EKO05_0006835 [Ascochyta rabiei]|uniref:uncharacterized protein n=1 Tax=Didymella rabiei TaxID=5454 RepID=UPI0018FF98EB|nr:uncharacterized protein EKO05_0006835 [Ascochyta rabiei]UPX16436.1 hypothetical protein EKO05_0006835 [Ascochyta rabiei]